MSGNSSPQPGDRSAALIRAVHAAAGPKVAILAPDGFGLYDDLVALAGPAAKGLYVSQYGVANSELPPRGREFLDSFANRLPRSCSMRSRGRTGRARR